MPRTSKLYTLINKFASCYVFISINDERVCNHYKREFSKTVSTTIFENSPLKKSIGIHKGFNTEKELIKILEEHWEKVKPDTDVFVEVKR